MEDLKPKYAGAAFEMSGPTFRLKDFAAYKAPRTAAPAGMRDQVTWSRRVLEAMEVPLFEVEGYEADDVIGALSVTAVKQGVNVIILSGDNDLLQLVNPHVKVVTSRRGISDTITYDEAKVIEKYFGLRPDQVPDHKALRGDVTDNIPGIAGIGDKGASKLLVEFGSVEALFDNLDSEKIPQKQRDLLAPMRDQVLLAKKLATIVTDLPVELDLDKARIGNLRRPEVIGIFQELSFKSLIDRIPKPPALPKNGRAQAGLFDSLSPTEPAQPARRFGRTVTTLEELDYVIQQVMAHGSFALNVQVTRGLPI